MEAAGIEPASDTPRKDDVSRGFSAAVQFPPFEILVETIDGGHRIRVRTWDDCFVHTAPLDVALDKLSVLVQAGDLMLERIRA